MATARITDAPDASIRLAVIVVNYRTPDLALACVDALHTERAAVPDLTVMLVDGGSADGSAEQLAEGVATRGWNWCELLALPVNGGFGYANNQALLRLAALPIPPTAICLLNPDAKPLPGAIAHLAAVLQSRVDAGAVGARLQDAEGTGQGAAFSFPSLRGEFSRGANTDLIGRLVGAPPIALAPAETVRVPWVTGAAVMFRVAALEEVGLFDDGFFLYFEEVELMHRLARAGWEIWHAPAARVEHIGGTATDIRWDAEGFHKPMPLPAYWYRSRRRYFARTGGAGRAVAASLLFVLGRLLWLARARLGRRPDRFPRRTSRDMLRHIWPSRVDRTDTRVPRLGDAPDQPPRWRQDAKRG